MRKTILIVSLVLPALFGAKNGFCQKASGKLLFQQGQTIAIVLEVKNTFSQEAMGNAIDFTSNGTAIHNYKITNSTEDNSTLHHEVKRITFNFDGMGQKRSFDSDNKKDLDGFFGAPIKDILGKTYDMIIDPNGKVLVVKPEKLELAKPDDRMAIVLNMLKDVTNVVYPPGKNESSFFKVLPEKEISLNEGWVESSEDVNGKIKTSYTLSAITDSTMVVDFKGTSVTNTKAEIMGGPTSTTLNNSFNGKIILNKTTGMVREKTIVTESTGNTEAMGMNMPLTSKTTVTIHVNPLP
jgi:hypothetical protein